MNSQQQDDLFLTQARFHLECHAAAADPALTAFLRQARAQALRQRRSLLWGLPHWSLPRWTLPHWAPATTGAAVATAAAVVVALSLWTSMPQQPAALVVPNLEDLDIISSSEDLEFLDELEFYRWLADSGHLG